MIYKDRKGNIHLIGHDMNGMSLPNGYYRHYYKSELSEYKKKESLLIENKSDVPYMYMDIKRGFYSLDKRSIIFLSKNGTRILTKEGDNFIIKVLDGRLNNFLCKSSNRLKSVKFK